jgi:hypothetical protein
MDQNKSQCPKMATTRITSRREEENMKNVKNIVKITATIAILFSFAMVFPTTTTASAQLSADRIFESEEDGFRVQVPQGWVIEDTENTPIEPNGEAIAMLCLENEALPGIGGEHNCQAASRTDAFYISMWPDLQSMPEFQNESDDNSSSSSDMIPITTNDLVALYIQNLQNYTSQIQIQNTTDVNEFKKIVTMTYIFHDEGETIFPWDDFTNPIESSLLFALSQDRNTGYSINNNVSYDNQTQQAEQRSPAVQEVFNSFEILEE